ncbi:MAG: protein TolQ [Candidatus Binatia bacterium]
MSELGVLDMISGSGPVVQGVLYLLILVSIASWTIIIFKARQISVARRASARFIKLFWKTRNLTEVSRSCSELPENPVTEVFRAGYDELVRLRTRKRGSSETLTTELSGVDNVDRAMRRAASLQRVKLEKQLTFLATTASSAPFVGLFGTVWGIMNSFMGLSAGGSSSIQAVAPGISEALVATAMGLAAAIPALVAYNHFARRAAVLSGDMDNFASEFLNIAERHFLN